jgi:hypothetical protein
MPVTAVRDGRWPIFSRPGGLQNDQYRTSPLLIRFKSRPLSALSNHGHLIDIPSPFFARGAYLQHELM